MQEGYKRKLFGLNGKYIEVFPIAKKETIEAWKRGELLFFPKQNCFASFEFTKERDQYMRACVVAPEDIEKWNALTESERGEWYVAFLHEHYNALSYEEFKEDDSYIEQDIEVTFPYGEKGIIFYQKRGDTIKMEV